MRFAGVIILGIVLSGLFSQPSLADKRVALVIGNSNYQNVGHLANPANDAAALAAVFKKADFSMVSLRTDLPRAEMRKVLRDFADQARDADIAVIYYAGHGIEVDGTNYLIPIDAVLERDTDVYDETFPLDRILAAVEPARQLRLIILDACRDNPFTKTMKRTIAQRGIGRGLAKVEPANPNTMIAFAAKAGFTAFDGDGKNSPFALALANHLTRPGLDLRKAFGFVRDDVLKATGNKQEPFIYGSLGGDDLPLVPAPTVAAPAPQAPNPNEAVRLDYQLAERVGTKEAWDYFIATYPNGFFTNLAQAQRNKLAAEEARAAATEKAKLAAEEKARLAAEGAKGAEQAKASAQAKATEEARKAEEARAAALQKALDDAKAAQATAEAKAAAVEAKAITEKKAREEKIASLAPPDQSGDAKHAADDVPRLLQTELRRVGCHTGSIDGNWNNSAQRSLALFNKNAGTTLNTKLANLDTLDVVRGKNERVCPLICEHGYKPQGDTCIEITCDAGFELGDDNSCVKSKSKKPQAKQVGTPEEPRPANRSPTSQSDRDFLYKCGATSCSAALRGCIRKTGILGVDSSVCTAKYNNCLQTGSFVGRYCDLHGLARN